MNIVPIDQSEPEPGSPLEFALRYAALGWHVFPVWGAHDGKCRCRRLCKSPAKHPVEHLVPRGQDDATIDPATIRRWYARMPEAGVAVFLKPSGLVAIDIDPRNGGFETMDDIEARHGSLVSEVMQFTQGGGEHRLFKLASDATGMPGKLGPGVDVKRNGYVVLDPTHGTAGTYDWEASSSPLDGVIPSPLPDWLRNLATPEPNNPVIVESIRFVTPGQIDELRAALASMPSDDRPQWVRFGLALFPLGQAGFDLWREWSMKSAKFDPVDLIRVWRSFKPGAVNFESIFFEAQEAGWINPLSSGAPPLPTPIAQVRIAAQPDAVETPAHLLDPPGILGLVAQWINATSRKPQPQFAVQAAIAFCATVMGRRYCTDQRNWPSLYLLNVGKSASGKEHGKWAVEHLLEACELSRLIGPASYTSDSGVLSALHRQPSHVTIIDEFGKVLEAASVKHSARAASAMRSLMEAWGRCDGTMRPQGYSTFGMAARDVDKMEERSVRNPALTLLAMTTPEAFFEGIGSAAARDGFLNRFLVVESDIGRQVGQHTSRATVPDTVIDWAREIHAHRGLADPDVSASLAAVPKMVPVRKEALDLFAAFEAECIALMDTHDADGMAEMFGRCNEIAMKLALVVAVASGWQVINVEHAIWSIDYARHYALRTVERLKTSVADSEFEALTKQVLEAIRKAGVDGLTERQINQRCRRFRAIDLRGKTGVLNTLAFTGDVARVEFPPVSGRGGKRIAWIAADNPQT